MTIHTQKNLQKLWRGINWGIREASLGLSFCIFSVAFIVCMNYLSEILIKKAATGNSPGHFWHNRLGKYPRGQFPHFTSWRGCSPEQLAKTTEQVCNRLQKRSSLQSTGQCFLFSAVSARGSWDRHLDTKAHVPGLVKLSCGSCPKLIHK